MVKALERIQMTEAETKMANTILEWLQAGHLQKNWAQQINNLFPEQEADLIQRTVGVAIAARAMRDAVGICPMSSVGIRTAMGIDDGELFQRSLSALKEHGRLLQAGRGRGKAIIVIDAEPMAREMIAAKAVQERPIGAPQKRRGRPKKNPSLVERIDAMMASLEELRGIALEQADQAK